MRQTLNALGGVGKIIGPLVLALLAGSSDFVEVTATTEAAGPAVLFVGVVTLLTAPVLASGTEPAGVEASTDEVDRSALPADQALAGPEQVGRRPGR
jgi:putative MFS transporter